MRLERVMLLAPHGWPARSYLPMFREVVPEIVCIQPPSSTQVVIVSAENDSTRDTSRQIGRYIQGSRTQEIAFKGSAYKTLPPKGTEVSFMEKVNPNPDAPIVVSAGKPPNLFVETWAGMAGLTKEAVLQGFIGKAYEKHPYKPDGDPNPMTEGDVMRTENINEIRSGI